MTVSFYVLFYRFMLTPFLYELRTLTDWIFTDTSLTFPEWLNVESIYAKIFVIKCDRNTTSDTVRGLKTSKIKKYLQGGGMTLVLILVLWFPLALFAYGSALGIQNIPSVVHVSFRIGSFENIYEMEAEKNKIFSFNESSWNNLTSIYSKHRIAYTFLNQYGPEDVVAVKLISNASKVWNISPSQRDQLLMQLKSRSKIACRFSYRIVHSSAPLLGSARVFGSTEHKIDYKVREKLITMFEDQNNTESVEIPYIFPKLITVQSSGKTQPIPQLYLIDKSESGHGKKFDYRNLTLKFYQTNEGNWWEMKEQCNDSLHKNYFNHYPYGNCNQHMTMYMFNEKIFPGALNKIAVKG